MWTPKYLSDSGVWLSQPRQFAMVSPRIRPGTYRAYVAPEDEDDDGEREITEDQIEGYALTLRTQCETHPYCGYGPVVASLADACKRVQQLDLAFVHVEERSSKSTLLALGIGTDEYRNLDSLLAIQHYEGCDIEVCVGSVRYELEDDDTATLTPDRWSPVEL